MAVLLSPIGGAAAQFFDDNGDPLSGGRLYTYYAGTSSPATTFTSVSGDINHPNPIIFDSAGRIPDAGEVWLTENIMYRFILQNSVGIQVGPGWNDIIGMGAFVDTSTLSTGRDEQTFTGLTTPVITLTDISYTPYSGDIDIFFNRVRLNSTDYTQTNSTTITLAFNPIATDVIVVIIGRVSSVTSTSRAQIGAVLYPISNAETAADVIPVDTAYVYGDVRRYGASSSTTASANVIAIQAALDTNTEIFLSELYHVNSTVLMNDNNIITGRGSDTGLYADNAVGFDVIAGKGVTTIVSTDQRRWGGKGRDFRLTGGSFTGTQRFLNMSGCCGFQWQNVEMDTGTIGIYHGVGYSSENNEYTSCNVSSVVEGIRNESGAVGIRVFGGNLESTTTAAAVDDGSADCQYHGVHVDELAGYGFKIGQTTATSGTKIIAPIISTTQAGTNVGVNIYANATDTDIVTPTYSGLTTNLTDVGVRTNASRYSVLTLTAVATTTSGTSIDFTNIPSWAKRVTLLLDGVSTNGSARVMVQLGDSGGPETSGYTGTIHGDAGGSALSNQHSSGFIVDYSGYASRARYGHVVLENIAGNTWLASISVTGSDNSVMNGAGGKTLSDTLDRIRLTTDGSNTFDAGTARVFVE